LCLTGLICAEGELWRDQRRFVTTCLKNFGMIKYGAKRDKMENRISVGVQESIEVNLLCVFFAGLLIDE
jgi:ecdysteroid 25-hydroxylase CYP306A1